MSEDVSETLDKSRKSHQSIYTIYMIMYINMCMLSIMLGAIGMYVPVLLCKISMSMCLPLKGIM